MSGAEIAAEVAAALAEAGDATGAGPLVCTIRRASDETDEPQTAWDEPADPANDPALYRVTAIERVREIRDMNGMLVGMQKRTLKIDATGVAPMKSDTIVVGVAPEDVTAQTKFEQIIDVRPIAPTGVPLMYELELQS